MPINLERDFKIVRVCPWEASIDDNIDWSQLTTLPTNVVEGIDWVQLTHNPNVTHLTMEALDVDRDGIIDWEGLIYNSDTFYIHVEPPLETNEYVLK